MNVLRVWRLAAAVLFSVSLAACGGGGPGTSVPTQQRSLSPLSVAPADIDLGGGYSGHFALGHEFAHDIEFDRGATGSAPCPSVPVINIVNHSANAFVVDLQSFSIAFPCSVDKKLFGVSFFPLNPQPAIVRSLKLGDATGTGNTVTFAPTTTTFTVPPKSISGLAILTETSTAEVGLPVAPGSTSVLTSSNSHVPTDLSFFYPSGSGAPVYGSSCFNAFNGNVLNPALHGVVLAGTPSFFCSIDPGNGSITFGNLVKFEIGSPKPDASVLGLDGNPLNFACTSVAPAVCNTPTFTVSSTQFRNVVVGNAADLRLCVPVTENQDCNALTNPAASRTTVSAGSDFQLLVADDPTYRPNYGVWSGYFVKSISGPCRFSTSPDNNNGDAPPGYDDNNQVGKGPFSEFDVTPTGTGTCTITMSEGPGYITDYSDPLHPKPRSASLAITISGSILTSVRRSSN